MLDLDKIRAERKERRLRLDELAQVIGCETSTYSRKESGASEFTADEYIKLCSFYKKPLNFFTQKCSQK